MSTALWIFSAGCWAIAAVVLAYHIRQNRAPAACGRMVCAWCVPMRDIGPAPALAAGVVSHGMCRACRAAEMAALDAARPRQGMTCSVAGSADSKRTGTPRAEAGGAAPAGPGAIPQTL